MSENNLIYITDDNGNELQGEILLTFEYEDKNIVLVEFPEDTVFAFYYDEDGNLDPIEDDETLELCAEVLTAATGEEDE